MNKITFCLVNNDYIEYLKRVDPKVQDNYSGLDNHVQKPYIYGVEIICNNKKYLIPLTSPSGKNKEIKKKFEGKLFEDVYSKITIKLIKEYTKREPEFLGALLLNNMIPLLESEITKVEFANYDIEYQNLLKKQYKVITKTNVREKIEEMANNIYNYVVKSEKEFFVKMCCNFKALEIASENYQNEKSTS